MYKSKSKILKALSWKTFISKDSRYLVNKIIISIKDILFCQVPVLPLSSGSLMVSLQLFEILTCFLKFAAFFLLRVREWLRQSFQKESCRTGVRFHERNVTNALYIYHVILTDYVIFIFNCWAAATSFSKFFF